jgi:hypothetical protein
MEEVTLCPGVQATRLGQVSWAFSSKETRFVFTLRCEPDVGHLSLQEAPPGPQCQARGPVGSSSWWTSLPPFSCLLPPTSRPHWDPLHPPFPQLHAKQETTLDRSPKSLCPDSLSRNFLGLLLALCVMSFPLMAFEEDKGKGQRDTEDESSCPVLPRPCDLGQVVCLCLHGVRTSRATIHSSHYLSD